MSGSPIDPRPPPGGLDPAFSGNDAYRFLFENAALGILVIDADQRIVDANPQAVQVLGFERDQLCEFFAGDLIHPDDRAAVPPLTNQSHQPQSSPPRPERRYRTGSGEYLPVEASEISLGGDFLFVMFQDISSRKRIEAEREEIERRLSHAQKMEAVGTLAGGVAHDFNNVLMAMMGYAELALLSIDKEARVREYMAQILRAGERATDTVKQILAFSRRVEEIRKPVILQFLAKEVLKLLAASLPATIEITEDIRPESGTVLADASQLHQVLMNLCTNAYQAMRESGGRLSVCLESLSAVLVAGERERKWVHLSVADTGPGMDQATVRRIFEPYYTTKQAGEGSGLGLAVVHGIVTGLGGHIRVESAPGQGSTFHVYLPQHELRFPTGTIQEQALPRGTERILFVDDERPLAALGEQMLASLGFRVTAVSDSRAALELFSRAPEEFDLVVTDQTMPGLTGGDLIREILRIRPEVPVVIYTGYSDLMDEGQALALGAKAFLMKPLRRALLAQTVRRLLDERPA